MDKAHLNLIPFASKFCSVAVYKKLLCMGYLIDILESDAWLENCPHDHSDVDVLLLGDKEWSTEKIQSVLEKVRGHATLALLCDDHINGSSGIPELCDDFTTWPCLEQELVRRLDRLVNKGACRQTSITNQDTIFEDFLDLNLLGSSKSFLNTLSLIRKIACCDAPVLIGGETGTGKEMAASAIHYLGSRRDHPFIPVNCGALQDSLIENELFGHERGAYTDAKQGQAGIIDQANGGTLFLDEVETLSHKGQVTLLRFLQDQRYQALGSQKMKQADVRIITATNASLEELVAQGKFRQDLLFRLDVMPVTMPPLRERTGDIALLAEHFIRQYSVQYHAENKCLHPETLTWMCRHPWPGNVRELENFIHREFMFADTSVISLDREVCAQGSDRRVFSDRRRLIKFDVAFNEAKSHAVSEFEKCYLHWLMEQAQWNVTYAAKIAGKERRALGKLLKKHQIKKTN